MHDRRIDGKTYTFGNQGALYMRAMTWWDHETQSVWSQPWGAALAGPLKGTRLDMIPANIMPWSTWLEEHPDTQVLSADGGGYFGGGETFSPYYVSGITLGDFAKSYPFSPASQLGVINDWLGPFPVLVLADAETKAVHTYLRRRGDGDLEFELRDGLLVDRQTGSNWDVARGIAVDGPLRGTVLQQVPYMTAFDWAWEDFYPHSEIYQGK